MYVINYKIDGLSVKEIDNLNGSINNIKHKSMESYWECQQLVEKVTLTISFERSTVKEIRIRNTFSLNVEDARSRMQVIVQLCNLSGQSKLNHKTFERIKFESNTDRVIPNSEEMPFTCAIFELSELKVNDQVKLFSIYSIELVGRPMFVPNNKLLIVASINPSRPTSQQHSDRKQVFTQRMSSPPKSPLSVVSTNRFTKLLSQTTMRKMDNTLMQDEVQQKREATKRTLQFEDPVRSPKTDSFDNECMQAIQASIQTQREEEEKRTRDQQSQRIEKPSKARYLEILPSQKTDDEPDWEYEDMYALADDMLSTEFREYHTIFEISKQASNSLTDHLRKQYKPLKGVKLHIPPDVPQRDLLIDKAERYGATNFNDLTQDVNLIVLDRKERYDYSKIPSHGQCAIVYPGLIHDCDATTRRFPNLTKYEH